MLWIAVFWVVDVAAYCAFPFFQIFHSDVL
jgi:hypothetical protein